MTNFDAQQALAVKLDENDADAPDVRSYLAVLLETLLRQEEGFSGKRPFGNSGWLYDIMTPLADAGFKVGDDKFITQLVDALCGTETEE